MEQICWMPVWRTVRARGKKGCVYYLPERKNHFCQIQNSCGIRDSRFAMKRTTGFSYGICPFAADAPLPEFKECARHPHIEEKGYVLYYTSQCPFNAKYVPIVEEVARENGVSFRAIHLQSKEEAQNAPTPVTTYALFYDGAYLTNEQMNDRKFLKLLSK